MKVQIPSQSAAAFVRSLIGSFSALIILSSAASVDAQSLAARPVARLITSTGNTNPRRTEAGATTVVLSSPTLGEATQSERHAFVATNEVRLKNGLAPLEWDPELCVIARRHSRDMSVFGFFSHQTPEGLRLRDRARLAGIRYQVIAENIAYNQGVEDPGAFAVERWMISPGHRANLLGSEFRASAVGTFVAPDGRVYLTQLFILR